MLVNIRGLFNEQMYHLAVNDVMHPGMGKLIWHFFLEGGHTLPGGEE